MKNERDNVVRNLPRKTSAETDVFSFEAVMRNQSREIIIKDFVPHAKSKPSEEKIDKASSLLNAFRMGMHSGSPTSLDQALSMEKRVNAILNEPTRLDTSKRSQRTKKNASNKAA